MDLGTYRVEFDGESHIVQPTPADLAFWERYAITSKLPLDQNASNFPKINYMTFLCYSAGRRSGLWPKGSFDSWLNGYQGLQMLDEDEAPADGQDTAPKAVAG